MKGSGANHYPRAPAPDLVDLIINPLTAKLLNWNFPPLEVVARSRDPQLQVGENYSDLTKWRSAILLTDCHVLSLTSHVQKLV